MPTSKSVQTSLNAALAAFTSIERHRSFKRAAAELGISRSYLSKAILKLEADLGTRLLYRNTRRVALTEAGETLAARASPALQKIAEALEDVTLNGMAPAGEVRLGVMTVTAAPFVSQVLADFPKLFPQISLDIHVGQSRQQHTYDGMLTKDRNQPPNMNVLKLTEDPRTLLCCAPRYLAGRSPPRTPFEVHQHRCIMMRWRDFDQVIPWIFERDGERISLDPKPSLIVDDAEYLTRALVEGAGLGRISADFAAPFLNQRELLSLLPEWAPHDNGLNLVWDRSVPVRPPFNALLRYFKTIRLPGHHRDAQSAA